MGLISLDKSKVYDTTWTPLIISSIETYLDKY